MPEGDDDKHSNDDGQAADEGKPAGSPDDTAKDDDAGKPNGKPADTGQDSNGGDDWKARARQHEDRAKANKKAADEAAAKAKAAEDKLAAVLKAAGLADEEEDPTEAVKRSAKERDDALADAKAARAELTAERVAYRLGADVARTLDSKTVEKALLALDDPTDEAAVRDVIKQALKDHPHLKATTAPPASASTDMTGGGDKDAGSGPQSIDDRIAARRKRRGIT